MPLETVQYISDLVATNPLGSDLAATADDHCRIIKSAIKTTFPNINGAITATDEEINFVDGVTSAIQTQLDGKLGIGSSGTVSTALIFIASASFAINLAVSRSDSGATVDLRASNESNTASSNARITTRVAGTSAGDAIVNYEISGGQQYTSGIDNSDSDAFKIQGGASLSASAGLSITTANVVRYDNKEIGFRQINIVTVSASASLQDANNGRVHLFNGSSGQTITVDGGVTTGSVYPIFNDTANSVDITIGAGVIRKFQIGGTTDDTTWTLAAGGMCVVVANPGGSGSAWIRGDVT